MRRLLSQGVPFVVNNIEIRGKYDPDYFINKYHGHHCRVHYVNTGKVENATVEQFFRTFGNLHPPEARAKLKVCLVILSFDSFVSFSSRIGLRKSISGPSFGNFTMHLWMSFLSRLP